MRQLQYGTGRTLLSCIGAAAVILVLTYICARWTALNPTTVGFVYLITILLIATSTGLIQAVTASVLATLCFNFFFLPPLHTLTIQDPLNWVSLIAFLLTSLIASELSERARRRTREAENRQLEMERLYAVSRAILLADPQKPVTAQLSHDLARIYEVPFVAVYNRTGDHMHSSGSEDIPGIVSRLKEAALQGTLQRNHRDATIIMGMSFGGKPVGGLALKGIALSDTALQALSNLVSLAIERARAHEAAVRADAARQSEEFKSTLMDALAHEFKTPLTSIMAAVTAIASSSVKRADDQREMLDVIDEATNRLSSLVTETIRTARIEAGGMQLHKEPMRIQVLFELALERMKPVLESGRVNVSIDDDVGAVFVDPELMQLVLRHLIDNAVKYSPPASPISLSAQRQDDSVVISVHNEGDELAEWERDRIFDKFYRGATARERVPGTGMGLAIVREVADAHGGSVRVESSPGNGVEFILALPSAKEQAST
jgi:two-component system sensor histidine kinase KdpD